MADFEKISGPDHPDTITARVSLASAYRRAGKSKHAIAQYKRVLQDRDRTAGADHPETISARPTWPRLIAVPTGSPRPSRSTSARSPTASVTSVPITLSPRRSATTSTRSRGSGRPASRSAD